MKSAVFTRLSGDLSLQRFFDFIDQKHRDGSDFWIELSSFCPAETATSRSTPPSSLLGELRWFTLLRYPTPQGKPFPSLPLLMVHQAVSSSSSSQASTRCLMRLAPYRSHFADLPSQGWRAIVEVDRLVGGFQCVEAGAADGISIS